MLTEKMANRHLNGTLYLPNKVFSFFCRSVCSRLTFPPGEAAKVSSSFTYSKQEKMEEESRINKNIGLKWYDIMKS